jgi:UDP-glucuronate decarboxylase
MKHKNFKFIKHDICKPFSISGPVHYVLDFASPASPIDFARIPLEIMDVGSIGVKNSLELAKRKKATFLLASTSEVYGDPLVYPQTEEYWGNVNTIGIRSCYDEGKRVAETLFFDYYRQYDVDIKVVRIFNTYGPKMSINDGRVVSNFIVQALKGQDITIYGKGDQTRSFCYVDDLVDGIISFMNAPNATGPINLGNPGEFTMIELAQKVLQLTKSQSKLVFLPLPQNDPMQRQPDISKAKKLINFSPDIKLEEGLIKTIAYFEKAIRSNS